MNNKNFPCLDCLNCKTRTFENTEDLRSWCGRKSIICNRAWIKYVSKYGAIRLLWCAVQTDQYCPRGFAPRNASPEYSMNGSTGNDMEITTSFKKPFIPDCPYKEV